MRHAFIRLNGIIAGMSILTTASTPVPIKIPVNTRLSGIMTRVISTEPTASPAAMPFLPPIFLYIRPDARTSTPDAQKCRIEQEAAQVGITADDLKQNVMKLSGGMRRRIALLRALLYDADCVILDEPFKGLDATTKQIVMQYVKEKVAGRTTFLVTHEQAEADFFGGNIWKLPQENKNDE